MSNKSVIINTKELTPSQLTALHNINEGDYSSVFALGIDSYISHSIFNKMSNSNLNSVENITNTHKKEITELKKENDLKDREIKELKDSKDKEIKELKDSKDKELEEHKHKTSNIISKLKTENDCLKGSADAEIQKKVKEQVSREVEIINCHTQLQNAKEIHRLKTELTQSKCYNEISEKENERLKQDNDNLRQNNQKFIQKINEYEEREKVKTSHQLGVDGEKMFENFLNDVDLPFRFEETAKIKHSGDYCGYLLSGKKEPVCVVDIKNYSRTVPKKEFQKLLNDTKEKKAKSCIMISLNKTKTNNHPLVIIEDIMMFFIDNFIQNSDIFKCYCDLISTLTTSGIDYSNSQDTINIINTTIQSMDSSYKELSKISQSLSKDSQAMEKKLKVHKCHIDNLQKIALSLNSCSE